MYQDLEPLRGATPSVAPMSCCDEFVATKRTFGGHFTTPAPTAGFLLAATLCPATSERSAGKVVNPIGGTHGIIAVRATGSSNNEDSYVTYEAWTRLGRRVPGEGGGVGVEAEVHLCGT